MAFTKISFNKKQKKRSISKEERKNLQFSLVNGILHISKLELNENAFTLCHFHDESPCITQKSRFIVYHPSNNFLL